MTALSIAWLYLDSMSSNDDVVLRACRSKSSLATSISLSFICRVRFESRSVVISFSSAFWDALASVLDSLYFLFHSSTSKPKVSAFSCKMRSCFSALSISFSNSCSNSLLDSLNSASSDSSCSYCALYQLRVSSAVASAPGGDEGGSEAMTDSSDRVSRWFGSIGFAWVWFGSGREPRYGVRVGGDDGVGGWGWGDKIGWSKRKRTEQRRRLFVCRLCLSVAQRPSRPFAIG